MSVDNALYLLDPSQPLPLSTRLDAIACIENALVGCVDLFDQRSRGDAGARAR